MSEEQSPPKTAPSLTLTLSGYASTGEATACAHGQTYLVPGGIKGENVTVEILAERDGYRLTRIIGITDLSPYRQQAPCIYTGQCTGCQWQHINYWHQLQIKKELVMQAIQRVSLPPQLVSDPVPAPAPLHYRNHARLTVRRREGTLGFINQYDRHFIKIDHCQIMAAPVNRLLAVLQGKCQGESQVSIRAGIESYLIQPKLKNDVTGLVSGQPEYCETMNSRRFRVSSASFFQVNTTQAEQMVDLIRQRLCLTGEDILVDAYAGVGTFAALLAPYARRVLAIEESAAAVKDARENICGLANVELVQAKTEKVLQEYRGQIDALILDPPRAGCHNSALRALSFNPPKRLVYVSCNPETLARDLKSLDHGPFRIEEVLPVDMFPQTCHVECLATIVHQPQKQAAFSTRQQLILASESPRRQAILADMGLDFAVRTSAAEEGIEPGTPAETAQARAAAKAKIVALGLSGGTVIAADTVVAFRGELFGKPRDIADATEMLKRLQNTEHDVFTAIHIIDAASGEAAHGVKRTTVTMRSYSESEIDRYVKSGLVSDKAGAYGIQDADFNPVFKIKGCYLNVVGLPVCLLLEMLADLGVYPPLRPGWRFPGQCSDCIRINT